MTEAAQVAGLRVRHTLQAGSGGGPEPFGFADGLSQPVTDWSNARDRTGYDYRNLIAPGEVLLGYENEYGQYTERPLLSASADPAGLLPQAADDPVRRDLGRNGTYLVFRHLAQDVAGFWRFLDAAAGGNRAQATVLAEAFVGRRLAGAPLLDAGHAGIAGVGPEAGDVAANGFTYDADPDGQRCPLGAHVRRANPRNGDLPGGRQNVVARLIRTLGFAGDGPRDDVIASSRFHRIVRRGRPYGGDGGETGLHFICLNANIARQFEFVQNAWLMSATFDGCDGETDPLLGRRKPLADGRPTDAFLLPQPNGARRCIGGLPQFVTVRGGGYFFMPGLRALRFLARG
jgi:deferrochelatase/peroxidase EfeB